MRALTIADSSCVLHRSSSRPELQPPVSGNRSRRGKSSSRVNDDHISVNCPELHSRRAGIAVAVGVGMVSAIAFHAEAPLPVASEVSTTLAVSAGKAFELFADAI